ncbi:hypothetical protein BHE74_00008620 [Ensete ventricosum]|nr:hypothetical protein BHE74_00008620 [Ensete ventricosum]
MGDKSGRREMSSTPENVVVVAVRAEREISKTALAWALTHVVRPGDVVTLLAVLADREATGKAGAASSPPPLASRSVRLTSARDVVRRLAPVAAPGLPQAGRGSPQPRKVSDFGLLLPDGASNRWPQRGRYSNHMTALVINVRIKVVGSDLNASGSSSSSSGDRSGGVVVAESKRVGANWVVLDK